MLLFNGVTKSSRQDGIHTPEPETHTEHSLGLGEIRRYIFETGILTLAVHCPAAPPATVADARGLIWRT
jgi:hypothetical protein